MAAAWHATAGDVVHCALRSSKYGTYVVSQKEGDIILNKAEPPQRWTIEFVTGNTVGLKSALGKYLCAEKTIGFTGSIKANRPERSSWETWTMTRLPNGRFTFLSSHLKYLSAEKNATVKADETKAGDTEEWDILPC